MMKFLSRLDSGDRVRADQQAKQNSRDGTAYDSVVRLESKSMPGVMFEVNRISFGRRMELARRVREISQRVEFLEAGNEVREKIEANILNQEVETTYLRWGLVRIEGLTIDGEPATSDRLIEKGPEELAREIVKTIKDQCGLSEPERKN
jgi:hypothetical protein